MRMQRPRVPFFIVLIVSAPALGQEHLIPFQGHLTQPKAGGAGEYEPVPNGQYDILFAVYTSPVGGESLAWGP